MEGAAGLVPSLVAKGIKIRAATDLGGPVITASGLIFVRTGADLTVHAVDEDSGRVLWEKELKSGPKEIPSVLYEVDAREYVVFCGHSAKISDNLPADLH